MVRDNAEAVRQRYPFAAFIPYKFEQCLIARGQAGATVQAVSSRATVSQADRTPLAVVVRLPNAEASSVITCGLSRCFLSAFLRPDLLTRRPDDISIFPHQPTGSIRVEWADEQPINRVEQDNPIGIPLSTRCRR